MKHVTDKAYQARLSGLLRSAANDLKRDDATAEADLGLPAGTFAALTRGSSPIAWEHLRRAAEVWPLNERDLLPIHNDCPDGVLVCPAQASAASSRTLSRGGTPYYEYRDTAMSRVASFRPEWIRMLCVVDDHDPANPMLRWNDGHLLYQFTYFVGPVNYYYRLGREAHGVEMDTGDSVWGHPFAPHTFAARDADRPAHILALTYGGGLVGDAQRELGVLGPGTGRRLAIDADPAKAQGALLRGFLQARAADLTTLATWSGLPEDRLAGVLAGAATATLGELQVLADALRVSLRDLLPVVDNTHDGVRVTRRADARRFTYPSANPAYEVVELASNPFHPHTTALEIGIRARTARDDAWLRTAQHQYLYVLDGSPVEIAWEHDEVRRQRQLAPGDSCYVLPDVPVALTCDTAADGAVGTVLVLRIGGAVTTDVRFALGAMADGEIARYVREGQLWYGGANGAGGEHA